MLKPALTVAKAGVKTAGTTLVGTGIRLKMAMGGMLEAPWSKVRQLELTRQPGVMSMGGVGSFKVGVKAPAGSTPLEIATAGAAPTAATEASVTTSEVNLNPQNVATHQRYLKELKTADIETRVEALLDQKQTVLFEPGKVWDINRIIQQYGGTSADWFKKSTPHSIEGIQIHYLENIKTGQKVETKHMIEGYLKHLRESE